MESDTIEEIVSVLRGGFESASSDVWKLLSFKLMCFVSSTFTDSHLERDIIQEKITPKLRHLGRQYGIDIVFVDMRYGVRDENTADHSTWKFCSQILEECANNSTSTFFLSLQGGKYGSLFVPREISVELFEHVCAQSPKLKTIAFEWFTLDENAIPPHYVLNSLTDIKDLNFWDNILPALVKALTAAPISLDALHADHQVGQSITEWELRSAITRAGTKGKADILWAHRQFGNAVTLAEDPDHSFSDLVHSPEKVIPYSNLMQFMQDNILPENKIDFLLSDLDSRKSAEYEMKWEDVMTRKFEQIVRDIVEKKKRWLQDGRGVGLEGVALTEMLKHSRWARNKCDQFFGREHLLEEAMQCIYTHDSVGSEKDNLTNDINESKPEGPNTSEINVETVAVASSPSNIFGISVCILGHSGAGKTALMAKLAQMAYNNELTRPREFRRPVIIRFCGTTPGSVDGMSLVNSIIQQISFLFKIDTSSPNDSECSTSADMYQMRVKKLHQLLRDRAVVLLIDSLDQLRDDYQARSRISFLKGCTPHSDTRIIVSCLPDERSMDGNWKYCYGCDSRLMEAQVKTLMVANFGNDISSSPAPRRSSLAKDTAPEEKLVSRLSEMILKDDSGGNELSARNVLEKMLEASHRRLTSAQWTYVMRQCKEDSTVLYLQMACRVVSTWKSGSNQNLGNSLFGLLCQIFYYVEREFGEYFTRTAFGLITYSREGLSDNEIVDILSCDDKVLNSVFQYATPNLYRLPTHVWLRLRGQIPSLLVERENGCLVWYHRQLREFAADRYQDRKKDLHSLMGKYFGNLLDPKFRSQRRIADQPLTLEGLVWFDNAIVNKRRSVESAYHLVHSGTLPEEAALELCNVERVCAAAKCGNGFMFVTLLSRLLTSIERLQLDPEYCALHPNMHKLQTRVQHYYRWLRNSMSIIALSPSSNCMSSCQQQPIISIARLDMTAYIRQFDTQAFCPSGWNRPLLFGGKQEYDSQLAKLVGHTDRVWTVAYSPDGTQIFSGSSDGTLRLWDAGTGAVISIFEGHSDLVKSASFSPDGKLIASSSRDRTIRIWDCKTGALVHILTEHNSHALCVAFSPNGQCFASGGEDHRIILWDSSTGSVLATLLGHESSIPSLEFSPDGEDIVSCSWDNSIRIWSVSRRECVAVYFGHTAPVMSVAFSRDGDRIVSGGADQIILVWQRARKIKNRGVRRICVCGISESALDGAILLSMERHTSSVTSVAFSIDGHHIVSASQDTTVCVWDSDTGEVVSILKGNVDAVNSVAYSPDGKHIVAGGWDKAVHIWESPPVDREEKSGVVSEDSGHIYTVAFSPDGRFIAAGSENSSIVVRDSDAGTITYTLTGHSGGVYSVAYSSDGSLIASGGGDCTARVWNAVSKKCDSVLEGHTGKVMCVSFSSDMKLIASGSMDNNIFLWELSSTSEHRLFQGHSDSVQSVDFNPTCDRLVSGSTDKTVRVWDIDTGDIVAVLEGHAGKVNSVAYCRGGIDIISGCRDNTIRVWNSSNGEVKHTLTGHLNSVSCVSVSSDGSQIASSSLDGTVRVWDFVTGDIVCVLSGHIDTMLSVSFCPNGHKIASASSNVVCLWDSSSGSISSV